MSHHIALQWTGGKNMKSAINGFDIPFTLDAASEGTIDNSKKLMLVSLAACTAFDIVSLLEKMRVTYTDFQIAISASLTEEHPRIYKDVHLIYLFKGHNIDKSKVDKAVRLSAEKYCGVTAMFKYFAGVTYEIRYE